MLSHSDVIYLVDRTLPNRQELRRRAEEEKKNVRAFQEQQASQLAQRIEQDVLQKKEHMMRRESERRTGEALVIAEEADPVDHTTEDFENGVHVGNIHFINVRLSFPRRGTRSLFNSSYMESSQPNPYLDGLETIYYAEPVSDDHILVPLLELHRIEFDADHYTKGQGDLGYTILTSILLTLLSSRAEEGPQSPRRNSASDWPSA